MLEGYVEKVGKVYVSKKNEKNPQKAKTLRNLIPDEAELVRIKNFYVFLIGE